MSCKLQPFCVKRTYQDLTNRNVSYSILLRIQQRLIGSWPLFFCLRPPNEFSCGKMVDVMYSTKDWKPGGLILSSTDSLSHFGQVCRMSILVSCSTS